MSNISPIHEPRTFTPSTFPLEPAPVPQPELGAATRVKRSLTPQAPATPATSWTLRPLPPSSGETSSSADRSLQTELGGSPSRQVADKTVQLQADTTIYALFDAYRSAFNTPELQAWFLSKGMALSTVVVKPDSVSGSVTRDGVSSVQTFTTSDASGWWQASARLRVAAKGLDPEGKGLPYVSHDSDSFSRNAILRWYGVQPPTLDSDVQRVQHELSQADWSAPTPAKKAELQSRVQTARTAIDTLDERAYVVGILTPLVAGKPDSESISLAALDVQVGSTSALARNSAGKVPLGDLLHSYGVSLPATAGVLRNAMRWFTASLPPPPPYGNYSAGLAQQWSPGALSAADRAALTALNDDPDPRQSSASNLLQMLGTGGVLSYPPEVLRTLADHFIDRMLQDDVALLWGDTLASDRRFYGVSGTTQLSDQEREQWLIAAIKLQVDPNAPGRPGTVAGYDLYQAGNSGRSIAQVREDVEAHLKQNKLLDPRAAPLAAHLLLASAAPEFLVRDVPPTLRVGSEAWADLRLGVAIAEHLGGAGCSRTMSYQEVLALSRLGPRNLDETTLLRNYGVDILLDWGAMQGLYAKTDNGRYTPQQYELATKAFGEQRAQLIQAFRVFNAALPTRQGLAIANLQKAFPDLSVQQLKTMRVGIANADERRNMKLSEPRTRSLVETYMSADLTPGRWMLLAPGEQVPQPAKSSTPFGFNQGLSETQQAAVDRNVQALDAKIANLPDVNAQVPVEVDTYLDNLKHGLGTTTRQMIANLPLADRQALELGSVELFALREQIDAVPKVEQTPEQVEERRGRKGTLIRSEYKGVIRYFEVFPDKVQIVKREDLPAQLNLGGTLQDRPKAYGRWAPSITQLQKGAEEPFDFKAYSSSAAPRPGVSSPGIIIDKLGDTLAAAPPSAEHDAAAYVPNSFSSARTQSIVDRIMQGNFIHHRDSVVKIAEGKLPLEQQREVLAENDKILLGMVPFVGAIRDLANGDIVEGSRALIIDTVGAFLGGAGSTLKPFVKATQVVAPFGAKSFHVLENGVKVISGFLNPFDGGADLLASGAKGVIALPTILSRMPSTALFTVLGTIEEKLRTFLGVRSGLANALAGPGNGATVLNHNGKNHSVPVHAVQVGGNWYATNPKNGLPIGTPLDGYEAKAA